MNSLVLTHQTAQQIIANQTGNHRLGPISLTDGRWFLMADTLTDNYFRAQLEEVEYELVTWESIQDLLPISEDIL